MGAFPDQRSRIHTQKPANRIGDLQFMTRHRHAGRSFSSTKFFPIQIREKLSDPLPFSFING